MSEQQDATSDADASDAATKLGTDETSGSSSSDDDSKSKSLFDQFDEAGLNLRDKYASEADLVKGLAEATRLVGKKNDRAEAYDHIRTATKGREAEFADFLQGKPAQQIEPSDKDKASKATFPTTAGAYQLLQSRVYDGDGKVRSNADREDVQLLRKMDEQITDAAVQLGVNRKAFFKEELADFRKSLLEEIGQSTSQQFADSNGQIRLAELNKREAEFLYVDGEMVPDAPLTEWGKKAVDEYSGLVEDAGLDHSKTHVRLWEKAINLTKRAIPKQKGTRTVSPHAEKQTPIGGVKPSKIDEKAFFRKHGLNPVPLLVKQGKLPASMLEEEEEESVQNET